MNYKYKINGNRYEIEVQSVVGDMATVLVNGQTYKVEIEREPQPEKKKVVVVAPAAPKAEEGKGTAVVAPLPGVIADIKVKVGDTVKIGDTVVILEAMKMENNLDTEVSGTVKEILVQAGESVKENTPLVVIE